MAASTKSYTKYELSGTAQSQFPLSFPYFNVSDITVELPPDYTGTYTINASTNTVELSSPISVGTVLIRRHTPQAVKHIFANMMRFNFKAVDENFKQCLYWFQEAMDSLDFLSASDLSARINEVEEYATRAVATESTTRANAISAEQQARVAATNSIRSDVGWFVGSISALRSLPKSGSNYAYLLGYYGAGDGGSGVFYLDQSDSTSTDNGVTTIVANDGGRWKLAWDGRHLSAAQCGILPTSPDCGVLLGRIPLYAEVSFLPAKYTFLTYPSEDNFSNRFYRGAGTVWDCSSSSTPEAVAFTWHYNYTDITNNGDRSWDGDAQRAGLSPIEGVLINGPGHAHGKGFVVGNSGVSTFYLRPRNFGVSGFGVGFSHAYNVAGFFLTGLENVTLIGNGINVAIDLSVSTNSGEQVGFVSCYFGNSYSSSVSVVNCAVDFSGCSFDYNNVHLIANNSIVRLRGCHIESRADSSYPYTPGAWFTAQNASTVVIDGTCYISDTSESAALAYPDFFELYDLTSRIYCDAIVNAGKRIGPMYSGSSVFVFGKPKSGSGAYGYAQPPLASKNSSLVADGDFATGALSHFPGSSGVSIVSSPVRGTCAYSASISGINGGTLRIPKIRVTPGDVLYLSFFDMIASGSLNNPGIPVTFFDSSDVQVGPTRFLGSLDGSSRGWKQQLAETVVPYGAAYASVVLSCSSGGTGTWYLSEVYAY